MTWKFLTWLKDDAAKIKVDVVDAVDFAASTASNSTPVLLNEAEAVVVKVLTVVGNAAAILKIAAEDARKNVVNLTDQLTKLNEELRQQRAAQSAAITGLQSIAADPALTTEERDSVAAQITAAV